MAVFKFLGQLFLDYPLVVLAFLFVMNVISLIAYYADKKKAQKGAWRIPEATLIGLSWAFGSVGAMIGMYHFRHKTGCVFFGEKSAKTNVVALGFCSYELAGVSYRQIKHFFVLAFYIVCCFF